MKETRRYLTRGLDLLSPEGNVVESRGLSYVSIDYEDGDMTGFTVRPFIKEEEGVEYLDIPLRLPLGLLV